MGEKEMMTPSKKHPIATTLTTAGVFRLVSKILNNVTAQYISI